MPKSRLNRRIDKVKNNISGRQKLLKKLLKIKKGSIKKPKNNPISSPPKRPLASRRPRRLRKQKQSRNPLLNKSQMRLPLEIKKKVLTPLNKKLDKELLKVLKNDYARLNNVSQNNIEYTDESYHNHPHSNHHKDENHHNHPHSNHHNHLHIEDIDNECSIINVHDEDILLPKTYPGDLWVHNNLEHQRDKPLEYFTSDHLKEVYRKHRNICYGI